MLSTPYPEPSPNPAPDLQPPPTVVELPKHLGTERHSGNYEEIALLDDAGADAEGAGLMLYTSGTTNRPKGVLLPESAITAQCRALLQAWEYSATDRLLHVLPLHHIHGTINALMTPLFAGSTIEFLFPFNADTVWRRFALPFLGENDDPASQQHTNGNTNGVNGSAANGQQHSDLTSRTNGLLHHSQYNGGGLTARMSRQPITFFTVVPTVYTRLLGTHGGLPAAVGEAGRTAVSPAHMRVAISGSAALPTPLKRAWRELSRGTVLLERYGMTEVGMALSCGLHPADRVDGSVGWPLPGVQARLVDLDTGAVIPPDPEPETTQSITATTTTNGNKSHTNGYVNGNGEKNGTTGLSEARERSGEIQLRGANVFREYWGNPAATAKEFVAAEATDPDQRPWFRTGDVAVRRPAPTVAAGTGVSGDWARGPMWFILGRQSADIIKSGGEKVSALEVERELLSLPEVSEAAVLAVPSGKWGQKVGAVVVMSPAFWDGDAEGKGEGEELREKQKKQKTWTPLAMRRALKDRLANYKIPQVLRVVDRIDRNAMGKINKKVLVKKVFVDDFSGDEM